MLYVEKRSNKCRYEQINIKPKLLDTQTFVTWRLSYEFNNLVEPSLLI